VRNQICFQISFRSYFSQSVGNCKFDPVIVPETQRNWSTNDPCITRATRSRWIWHFALVKPLCFCYKLNYPKSTNKRETKAEGWDQNDFCKLNIILLLHFVSACNLTPRVWFSWGLACKALNYILLQYLLCQATRRLRKVSSQARSVNAIFQELAS